jgi:hypothetical protein
MSTNKAPADAAKLIDLYFMEHRAKLIDIAAFLDRLDRAADGSGAAQNDFRVKAFHEAVASLTDGPGRAARVLDIMSDPTETPIDKAPMKGALGAYDGSSTTGGTR